MRGIDNVFINPFSDKFSHLNVFSLQLSKQVTMSLIQSLYFVGVPSDSEPKRVNPRTVNVSQCVTDRVTMINKITQPKQVRILLGSMHTKEVSSLTKTTHSKGVSSLAGTMHTNVMLMISLTYKSLDITMPFILSLDFLLEDGFTIRAMFCRK